MQKEIPRDNYDKSGNDVGEKEGQLLHIIAEISNELHPGQDFRSLITLDSKLDVELGLDSLSRMELIDRIENRLDIYLHERALSLAETPRDLLREIEKASSQDTKISTQKEYVFDRQLGKDQINNPDTAKTLVEVLSWHTEHQNTNPHVHIIEDNDQSTILTYGELYKGACDLARGLLANDFLTGESVLLMLPTGREYFISFFGIILAGGVPVPIYPPTRPQQLDDHLKRYSIIGNNSNATFMITTKEVVRYSKSITSLIRSMRQITTCVDLVEASAGGLLPKLSPNDTAFIQYTSGSTGDPKGVVLSHTNLLANIRGMGRFLKVEPNDVFVSWLPLYHDMGLIGAWLGSLTFGIPLVILNPLTFLARPNLWLWAIHKYKGTISGAPNFGYETCLSRIQEKEIKGLDLSSWRVAFNGAEAVQPATLENFGDRFSQYGFNYRALMPVYGLAENTVGLGFPPPGRGPKFDRIDKQALVTKNRAAPLSNAISGQDALKFPSCGYPLPGHQVRIVNSTGQEVQERYQGRIQFKGPSSTSGYYRDADATKRLFDGDWLNSGDLGYLADGEIYITGRQKDLIIRAGRNIYPVDLEIAIGNLQGILAGNVAVFSSPHPRSHIERLIVVAGTRVKDEGQISSLKKIILRLSVDLTGVSPDDIVLVPPRVVPRTSSGKIRRQATRALYEKGFSRQTLATVNWQIVMILIDRSKQACAGLMFHSLSWMYTFYAWIILSVTALPIWLGIILIPKTRFRWTFLRLALAGLRTFLGIRVIGEGHNKLQTEGAMIVVANHASYIDSAILIDVFPEPFRFVAKSELKNNFFVFLFLSKLKTLFVERFDTEQSIKDADNITKILAGSEGVIFFPEGTFTRMPGILPFHLGAFAAAIDAGIPVVPVVIRGTRDVLRDGSFILKPGTISVRILDSVNSQLPDSADKWHRSIELRDKVRSIILSHCGEPDLANEFFSPANTIKEHSLPKVNNKS